MAVNASDYAAVKADLLDLIRTKKCNPLMIRLAWHDSGTFDKVIRHVEQHVRERYVGVGFVELSFARPVFERPPVCRT